MTSLFEDDIVGRKAKEAALYLEGYLQAISNVYSYSHGVNKVKSHVKYITREGELSVETDQGEVIDQEERLQELIDDWSVEFDQRKNSRDSANIVLSTPAGTSPNAVRDATREFASEYFTKNDYLFAVHDDTDHVHSHLMVKTVSRENKKLRLDNPELEEMRLIWAEKCRGQGIEVCAVSHSTRGLPKREQKSEYQNGEKLKDTNIEGALRITEKDKSEALEYIKAIESGKRVKENAEERYLKKLHKEAVKEWVSYADYAEEKKRYDLMVAFKDYAFRLKRHKSNRQKISEKVLQEKRRLEQASKVNDQSRGRDSEWER